jgi:hypothetical protein
MSFFMAALNLFLFSALFLFPPSHFQYEKRRGSKRPQRSALEPCQWNSLQIA